MASLSQASPADILKAIVRAILIALALSAFGAVSWLARGIAI